jgi:hypothetical protein
VGDLVFYQPSHDNKYADGKKQIGIILKIKVDINPLFKEFPETSMFANEYVVKWILSGYTSSLMSCNLKKLQPIE